MKTIIIIDFPNYHHHFSLLLSSVFMKKIEIKKDLFYLKIVPQEDFFMEEKKSTVLIQKLTLMDFRRENV